MAFRDVRVKRLRNRLVFRYDPDHDVIAIVVEGELVEVDLDDYRLPHQRKKRSGDNMALSGEGGDE